MLTRPWAPLCGTKVEMIPEPPTAGPGKKKGAGGGGDEDDDDEEDEDGSVASSAASESTKVLSCSPCLCSRSPVWFTSFVRTESARGRQTGIREPQVGSNWFAAGLAALWVTTFRLASGLAGWCRWGRTSHGGADHP
jgi:hypothetical protein